MQQGLCESFVWEEFTSHGLHSVKEKTPLSLMGVAPLKSELLFTWRKICRLKSNLDVFVCVRLVQ